MKLPGEINFLFNEKLRDKTKDSREHTVPVYGEFKIGKKNGYEMRATQKAGEEHWNKTLREYLFVILN